MTIAANRSINETSGIEYTKKYAKQMLKGMLFTGVYKEKRFVDDLKSYRDLITVCPEEDQFIENLKIVQRKIDEEVLYKNWLGITGPDTIGAPVGYNLWVILPEEVFGKYWYRVKTVEFLQHEIRLKLETVRPFVKESTPLNNTSEDTIENLSTILQEKKLQVVENLTYFFKNVLTMRNIKETVIFTSVFIGTLLAGFFNIIKYLLEYLLKLIRELSGFIKVATPIFITTINLVGKTIFGFYHLIYALFKGNPRPAPVYNNYINFDPNNLDFVDPRTRYNQYFNKALPYNRNNGGGPTITPIM